MGGDGVGFAVAVRFFVNRSEVRVSEPLPLLQFQLYMTRLRPVVRIAATASRWIRALRTTQPNMPPNSRTVTISPRVLNRRRLRQGWGSRAASMVVAFKNGRPWSGSLGRARS